MNQTHHSLYQQAMDFASSPIPPSPSPYNPLELTTNKPSPEPRTLSGELARHFPDPERLISAAKHLRHKNDLAHLFDGVEMDPSPTTDVTSSIAQPIPRYQHDKPYDLGTHLMLAELRETAINSTSTPSSHPSQLPSKPTSEVAQMLSYLKGDTTDETVFGPKTTYANTQRQSQTLTTSNHRTYATNLDQLVRTQTLEPLSPITSPTQNPTIAQRATQYVGSAAKKLRGLFSSRTQKYASAY